MKLYATITSERVGRIAKKGGNERLQIKLFTGNNLVAFLVTSKDGIRIMTSNYDDFVEFGEPIATLETTNRQTYSRRVKELEAEGLTTSDAQGVVDVEIQKGKKQKGELCTKQGHENDGTGYCKNCGVRF